MKGEGGPIGPPGPPPSVNKIYFNSLFAGQ